MDYKQYYLFKHKFSNIEFRDIGKALFGISLAFAVAFSGGQIFSAWFVYNFVISLIVVGIGFIFHEMGHKILAQRYGCKAEFRSFDGMLVIAVLIAFLGFVFVAPGAVMIGGKRVTLAENGKISAIGPFMNIILALVFFGLSFVLVGDIFSPIMEYGFLLNSLLAVFNMLPFGNFDGRKVLHWNKIVWAVMIVVSGAMFMYSYSIFL